MKLPSVSLQSYLSGKSFPHSLILQTSGVSFFLPLQFRPLSRVFGLHMDGLMGLDHTAPPYSMKIFAYPTFKCVLLGMDLTSDNKQCKIHKTSNYGEYNTCDSPFLLLGVQSMYIQAMNRLLSTSDGQH